MAVDKYNGILQIYQFHLIVFVNNYEINLNDFFLSLYFHFYDWHWSSCDIVNLW